MDVYQRTHAACRSGIPVHGLSRRLQIPIAAGVVYLRLSTTRRYPLSTAEKTVNAVIVSHIQKKEACH
jgi:hypothetical protein